MTEKLDMMGESMEPEVASESSGLLAAVANTGLAAFDPEATSGLGVKPPFAEPILLHENLRVAGTSHVEGIDEVVAGIEVGSELRFEREAGNLVDGWAIKVFAGSERIGYVPADVNEVLARLMDGGKHVFGKVCGVEKVGSWNKVVMEVYLDD